MEQRMANDDDDAECNAKDRPSKREKKKIAFKYRFANVHL